MSKTISNLSVGLFGDVSHFAKAFGGTATNAVKSFASSLVSIGGGAAALTGITSAIGAGVGAIAGLGEGFKLAADFEQTTVAMTTMLGSAEQAKQVLGDLKKFAAATPFQFPDLAASAKELSAFGVSADQIVPTLKMLGDVASGTGKPIAEMVDLYGKVKTQGRLAGEEIRQFTSAGIPLTSLLAKQLGKTPEQIRQMVEQGQVGFPQVQKAFIDMTSAGGRFDGMMVKQSGTLAGLFSTLKDTLGNTLEKIAESIIDTFNLKGAMSGLISNGDRIGDFFVGMVQRIAPAAKSIGSTIISGFGIAYNLVSPILDGLWSGVQATFAAISNFVTPIIANIAQWWTAHWQGMVTTGATLLSAAWETISSVFSAISDLVGSVAGWLLETWTDCWIAITGHTMTASQTIQSTFDGLGSAIKWLADTVTLCFRVMEFAVKNWQVTLGIAALEVAAQFSDTNDRMNYVGDSIMALFSYLGRNWRLILQDMAEVTKVAFTNIGENIVSVVKNLPGLIKGSVSVGDLWKPITDGFKSNMTEVFALPEFQNSTLTRQLQKGASDLEKLYGKALGLTLDNQEQKAKAAGNGLVNFIKSAFGLNGKPITPEIKAPSFDPGKLIPESAKNVNVNLHPHVEKAELIRWGSAEMYDWMADLRNEYGPPARPLQAPSPFNNSRGPLVGGVMDKNPVDAKGPGTNNDYLYQIWQNQRNVQVANFG